MLNIEQKKNIVINYQLTKNDTGSAEVQIALLTARINDLKTHFETHKKDNHSKRGLLRMVSKRRKMLSFLQRNNMKRYRGLINNLGLRR